MEFKTLRSRSYPINSRNCKCGLNNCIFDSIQNVPNNKSPRQFGNKFTLGEVYTHIRFERRYPQSIKKTCSTGLIKLTKITYDDVDQAFKRWKPWKKRNTGRTHLCLQTVQKVTGLSRQFLLSTFKPIRYQKRGYRYGLYIFKKSVVDEILTEIYKGDNE